MPLTYNNVDSGLLTKWTANAVELLQGKKIVEVRYLSDEEMQGNSWHKRHICFVLDSGDICVLSSDDEGNNGGAMFVYKPDGTEKGIPVLYDKGK